MSDAVIFQAELPTFPSGHFVWEDKELFSKVMPELLFFLSPFWHQCF
jgi:hypothetical protein